MKVRNENDPEGMFLGAWHYRVLPIAGSGEMPLGEREKGRRRMGKCFGDSIEWTGHEGKAVMEGENGHGRLVQALKEGKDGGLETDSPSPPATATSDDSFDYLAKGEASVHE
jgi:D-arabinono-1,4-lactone oxidase